MRVSVYSDVNDFLRNAQPFLERDEAANGLVLGIAFRLRQQPDSAKQGALLMTADEGGAVVLAGAMTPPHNLVLSGSGDPARNAVEPVVAEILSGGWTPPGVGGPVDTARAFAETWTKASGVPHTLRMRHRIYALTKVAHLDYSPGRFGLATQADLDVVARWFAAFGTEVFGEPSDPQQAHEAATARIQAGDVYLWEDGQAVSMAAKARPTTRGMAINHVYTPPEFRNRGYATSCAARLSQTLLDSGREFCCLFADLANPVSNGIYQKIGYRPVCDANDYRFRAEPA